MRLTIMETDDSSRSSEWYRSKTVTLLKFYSEEIQKNGTEQWDRATQNYRYEKIGTSPAAPCSVGKRAWFFYIIFENRERWRTQ